MAAWFRQNPEALIEALGGTETAALMEAAKKELIGLLAVTEPGRSLSLVLAWRLPLNTADGKTLAPWIRANPRQAAELVLKRRQFDTGSANDDRSLVFQETAKAMALTDPAGALQMKAGAHSHLQERFQKQVLTEWARNDLPAAAAYLSGKDVDQKRKNDWSTPLLSVWGAKDPEAALDWAAAELTGAAQKSAPSTFLKSLAEREPAQALALLDRLPPGWSRDQSAKAIASVAMRNKTKPQVLALFQQMISQPDPALRDPALEGSAGKLMEIAPDEFSAWLNTPDGARSSFAVLKGAAQSMADRQGVPAAMAWAQHLRPDAADMVSRQILGGWIHKDPAAAGAWVSQLPEGDERSGAVTSATADLARRMSGGDFTDWLDSLPVSDHPAILQGLEKSKDLNPDLKATLSTKYHLEN